MFGFNEEKEKIDDNHVWVAIIVKDGMSDNAEYRGRIEREIFEKITMNEMTNGWFRVDSTYWEKDRKHVPQDEAGYNWGYGNTTFLRAEWVSRIIILSDLFVKTLTKSISRH